jgi:hypothetical protein
MVTMQEKQTDLFLASLCITKVESSGNLTAAIDDLATNNDPKHM